jgi:hypothetical protein
MTACDLTEEQFNELIRLSRLYHREANRCMTAKSYLAGCVMIGAALEASLTCMAHIHADEIPEHLLPKKKNLPKPLLAWTLTELLRVARNCGWLPAGLELEEEWNQRKARIGDYAVVLKDFRNLVHPAVYLTKFPRRRVTKRRLEFCFDIFKISTDHLLVKIYNHINKYIEKEEHKGNAAG